MTWKEKGYTCKSFAEKLDIPSSTLDNYLRGRAVPSELLARIEDILPTLPKVEKLERADAGLEWYVMTRAKRCFVKQQTQKSNELNFYVPEKWIYNMDI